MAANPGQPSLLAQPEKPQAKEGGVLAGVAGLVREVGEIIATSGGIIVVLVGVGAVVTITSASLGTVPEGERATIAAAAFSVLGTIVGAYFGIRVGARGKEAAEEDRRVATAKVERLAAEADPARASEILDQVDRDAAEGSVGGSGGKI
jgi:hypothetical protein